MEIIAMLIMGIATLIFMGFLAYIETFPSNITMEDFNYDIYSSTITTQPEQKKKKKRNYLKVLPLPNFF